jgi:hypothetical protein
MSDQVEITDQALFGDVSKTIQQALQKTFEANPSKRKLAQSSYEIALKQLV